MPGTPRSEDELADLTAAAREMREAGMAMHEISHELAVPVSTLYQWAAQGRWRLKDIAAARMRAVFANPLTSPSLPGECRGPHEAGAPGSGQAGPSPLGPGFRRETGEEEGEDTPPPPLTPLDARAAGERAFKGAMALMEAGEIRAAGEAMRLAERMLLAARLLEGLPLPEEHDAEARAQSQERLEALTTRIQRMVHAALQGKVSTLPGWATTKEFLADTLYPDMYYREGEVGTGIAGHFGPGPADGNDLDAEFGFTEPETGEQSGPGPAS